MRKNDLMREPELDGLFIFPAWVLKEYRKHFSSEQIVQLIDALIKFTATDVDTTFDDPTIFFAFRYGCMEIMNSWDYINLFAERYEERFSND